MVLGCSTTFLEVPIFTDMVMVRIRIRVFQRDLLCSRRVLKLLCSCKGL